MPGCILNFKRGVCVCVVFACTQVSIFQSQSSISHIILEVLCALCFQTVFPWSSVHQVGQAEWPGSPSDGPISVSLALVSQVRTTIPNLNKKQINKTHVSWSLNVGPLACKARTLVRLFYI